MGEGGERKQKTKDSVVVLWGALHAQCTRWVSSHRAHDCMEKHIPSAIDAASTPRRHNKVRDHTGEKVRKSSPDAMRKVYILQSEEKRKSVRPWWGGRVHWRGCDHGAPSCFQSCVWLRVL